ncbi:SUR7/PalI family-domain-containing protein [Mortierella sp. GBAus27b]|nr:hypothetical protein BGX31_010122 [Mortierella sp. GBA43]KAI8361516.1 SUR7/PalI family-domain-containing protein [Mortierella sp. GBAus27b]
MFAAIVSFIVNLAITLLLFLVSIGDLATSHFFTTFHLLKVVYSQDGPQGGWLSMPYNVLTFGLWSLCEGRDDTINACSDPKVGFTLDDIPGVNAVDEHYIPNAVRSFNKVMVLFIPVTCVAFLALLLSFMALFPRFRKRWLHGISGFFMFLVTLVCLLLMIAVFTVNGYRKVQFERHLQPAADVSLGPGAWITLVLVPLTIFGSLLNGFAVCCPGRFKGKSREDGHDASGAHKEEAHDHQEHHQKAEV